MKIIVVDDNPHVLALMQQTLETHGEVEAYHDGADAFARATMSPPDLIVSDFRMKGMDGRALVERLRGRAETKEVPVILVATKADIDEELHAVADQVEEFVPKPFFARELAARAKRTLDKVFINKKQREVAAAGGSAIRGKLSEMNIMDLFQAMEMGVKTCLITISNTEHAAQIYFADGQVYHCAMASALTPNAPLEAKGDEVVNRVVKWSEGTFEINFNAPRSTEKTTETGTQGLLMEAMRLMDEENR
jgi:CheY-like chemotaxis protein